MGALAMEAVFRRVGWGAAPYCHRVRFVQTRCVVRHDTRHNERVEEATRDSTEGTVRRGRGLGGSATLSYRVQAATSCGTAQGPERRQHACLLLPLTLTHGQTSVGAAELSRASRCVVRHGTRHKRVEEATRMKADLSLAACDVLHPLRDEA